MQTYGDECADCSQRARKRHRIEQDMGRGILVKYVGDCCVAKYSEEEQVGRILAAH